MRILKALNIHERTRRREIRPKRRNRPNRSRLLQQAKVAEVYSFNFPDNIPEDLFGEVLEKVKKIEPEKQKLVD